MINPVFKAHSLMKIKLVSLAKKDAMSARTQLAACIVVNSLFHLGLLIIRHSNGTNIASVLSSMRFTQFSGQTRSSLIPLIFSGMIRYELLKEQHSTAKRCSISLSTIRKIGLFLGISRVPCRSFIHTILYSMTKVTSNTLIIMTRGLDSQ